MIFLQVIAILVLIYVGLNVVYMLLFAIAGTVAKKKVYLEREPSTRFCVMVPAYKGDAVILQTVAANLKQEYPKNLYDIYVIADQFKPETIEALKQYDVTVIEVHFENSTKAKSINKAFEVIEGEYDYVVVLDVDNIMEPAFLTKMNNRLVKNIQIVQAHRAALNHDTSFAILDGLSEEINNHILRKGHAALGFSSALIGSGMVLGFRLFKDLMRGLDAIGGFDKELELRIMRQRIKIHYLASAIVYDEKVRDGEVFQTQRTRWLSAQVYYMRKNFLSGIRHFFNGNFDYSDKILQLVLAPRVLLLGTLFIITAVLYITGFYLYNPAWLTMLVLITIALLLSVPRSYYTKKTFIALVSLPKAYLLYFATIFKLKGANRKFIHTPHGNKEGNA